MDLPSSQPVPIAHQKSRGRGGRGRGNTRGNNKTKRQTRSTANTFDPLSYDGGVDIHTCKSCSQIFTDSDDKMLICERCDQFVCLRCSKISEAHYDFLQQSENNIHYYCDGCDLAAVTAVQTDMEIEEKCKKFCEKIEEALPSKADKEIVDNLAAKIKKLEQDLHGLAKDVSNTNDKLSLARHEPTEKVKREKNIIIRGIPESDDSDDARVVEELLNKIGVGQPKIDKVERLGAKPKPAAQTQPQTESTQPTERADTNVRKVRYRPLRVQFAELESKKNSLRLATKVRQVTSTSFNPKDIFILPDQTKLEREEDLKLRKELKSQREKNPIPNSRF